MKTLQVVNASKPTCNCGAVMKWRFSETLDIGVGWVCPACDCGPLFSRCQVCSADVAGENRRYGFCNEHKL